MALWAFIPGKHLEAVGSLPQSARRLDTGQLINDLPGVNQIWTRACGWWNLDTIEANLDLLVATNNLTQAELEALTDEVIDALAERQARQQYVENARTAWAGIKDIGSDWLDGIPPYEVPTGSLTVGLLAQQVSYLYEHERRLTQWLGEVGDVVMVIAQVVAELAEQSAGIALPD
jgi:hypothetical protein